jgi:hypothetical protein
MVSAMSAERQKADPSLRTSSSRGRALEESLARDDDHLAPVEKKGARRSGKTAAQRIE